MIAMAISFFGGMLIQALTAFLAPALFCVRKEKNKKKSCTPANRGYGMGLRFITNQPI